MISQIILTVSAIVSLATIIHFHIIGRGALHHIEQEGFALHTLDYRDESNAFQKIMERSALFQDTCHQLPDHHLGEAKPKGFDTGVPPLPEHGVHRAMTKWLEKEAIGTNDRGDYPMCTLPPSKSCNVDTFTVILMSHTLDDDGRLKKLRNGIRYLSSWGDAGEIILVWNSAKSVLTDCQKVSTVLVTIASHDY
jgi:hypothetical protein